MGNRFGEWRPLLMRASALGLLMAALGCSPLQTAVFVPKSLSESAAVTLVIRAPGHMEVAVIQTLEQQGFSVHSARAGVHRLSRLGPSDATTVRLETLEPLTPFVCRVTATRDLGSLMDLSRPGANLAAVFQTGAPDRLSSVSIQWIEVPSGRLLASMATPAGRTCTAEDVVAALKAMIQKAR